MGNKQIINRIFSLSGSGPGYDNSTFKYSFQVKLIIIAISVFLCTLLFTFHFDNSLLKVSQHTLQIGTPWQNQTLKADNSYPIFKSKDDYNKLVLDAESTSMPVFKIEEDLLPKKINEFKVYIRKS